MFFSLRNKVSDCYLLVSNRRVQFSAISCPYLLLGDIGRAGKDKLLCIDNFTFILTMFTWASVNINFNEVGSFSAKF